MKKNDFIAIACLFGLMLLWGPLDRKFISPLFPPAPTPVPTESIEGPSAGNTNLTSETGVQAGSTSSGLLESTLQSLPAEIAELSDVPERFLQLTNDLLSVRLTNFGAGVARVHLLQYDATLEDKKGDSGVKKDLDFSTAPALVYDLPGLGVNSGFHVVSSNETSVVFERKMENGVSLQRTMTLGDRYVISIEDRWTNHGETDVRIPSQPIWMGRMHMLSGISQKLGPFLGVDVLHNDGEGVKHYVKKIRKSLNGTQESEALFEPDAGGLEWFTAKNKFFTQVLSIPDVTGQTGAEKLMVRAARGPTKKVPMSSLVAGTRLGELDLAVGQSMTREMTYFVGPMVMKDLRALGQGQEQAIDFHLFGFLQPFAKGLMASLTWIYGLVGNYGVAIILLTILVRTIMWPLTHKGTKSMKRMQEFAPEMKAIKEKYKDTPQKMNAEMGAFYKEHKINPMAGCLPMLIQMPVFLGLYGMLRVAVELRFEAFLWISDLSEAENIFPLFGDISFNLLPLTMGGTMFLQQRMMPTQMDPQQQKIMQFMPIMITVVCYSMPAGLLLYWTTSNILSIFQTRYTHKATSEPAPAKSSTPAKTAPGKKKAAAPSKGKGKGKR